MSGCSSGQEPVVDGTGQGPDGGVGAVVVSYRSATDLPACLEALAAARGVSDVVVVDNASDDGSAEVARATVARLAAGAAARLEVLALDRNTGFAGGCNRGLAALPASCRHVAFLNPDVRVEPECLERCAARLDREARLGGVAPRLVRPDGTTTDSLGQVVHRLTLEVRDLGYGTTGGLEPVERPVLAACGALAVLRRRALEAVAEEHGPWAEHFFCFWEDLELGWRLTRAGWPIVSVPDAVAVHARGAGAAPGSGPLRWRRPPELEACILSNRWMTLMRHLHLADLVLRLPVLLAWDTAAVLSGVLRRPRLAGLLLQRLPLVQREWRRRRLRGHHVAERPRLAELPC